VLEGWGYSVVRGSSSRGSKDAMAQMRCMVEQGHVLCMTPDGPRGPRHTMKMGAIRVAQTMHVPLIGMDVGYTRSHRLQSWDAFTIPFPFSKGCVELTNPIFIDPTLQGEALEEIRSEIENQLRALHRNVLLAAKGEQT